MKVPDWLDEVFQGIGIFVLVLAAVCGFGGLLDFITAKICPEYFLVNYPARWIWPSGLLLGILNAIAARWGKRPQFRWTFYTRPVFGGVVITAIIAGGSWALGYAAAVHETLEVYHATALLIPAAKIPVFIAAESAHQMSWLTGVLGGNALAFWTWKKRIEIEARLQHLDDSSA